MTVEICALNHQAIAFLGTCPLCRKVERAEGAIPIVEGRHTYAPDLDRALREHYVGSVRDGLVAAFDDDPTAWERYSSEHLGG